MRSAMLIDVMFFAGLVAGGPSRRRLPRALITHRRTISVTFLDVVLIIVPFILIIVAFIIIVDQLPT